MPRLYMNEETRKSAGYLSLAKLEADGAAMFLSIYNIHLKGGEVVGSNPNIFPDVLRNAYIQEGQLRVATRDGLFEINACDRWLTLAAQLFRFSKMEVAVLEHDTRKKMKATQS